MTQRSLLAVGGLLICCACYLVVENYARGQAVRQPNALQWEYEVIQESAQMNRAQEIERKLAGLGASGWDVCGLSSNMSAQGHGDVFYVVLKRPKQ